MKHIVFAHRKLSHGGGERVLVEQVAALAELPVNVSVIFRKEPGKRDIEAELRARNPHVGDILHLPGAFGCFRWLKAQHPDLVVLCNHKGAQRALPWLARFGTKFPLMVTLHEHYSRHLAKYRGIRSLVDRWIITWPFEHAVRSHLGAQSCALIHPLYERPAQSAVTNEERGAARRALHLPEQAIVVGYVGQIDERKHLLGVLRFADYLESTLGEPVNLVLAGREEAASARELDRALAASPRRGRTLRLGRVPETAPVMKALDAYVMTSRNEGFFPIALLEAMELGVPVIVPTVGGIASVLQDGHGGFLMDKPDDRTHPSDALLRETALRIAPMISNQDAWARQRILARDVALKLAQGYDAAARFREAVAPWL